MEESVQGILTEITEKVKKDKTPFWKMTVEFGDKKATINVGETEYHTVIKDKIKRGDKAQFDYKVTEYPFKGETVRSKWLINAYAPGEQPSSETTAVYETGDSAILKRIEEKLDKIIQYIGPEGMK